MQTEQKAQPLRLPHPVRITEQVWPDGTVPVVSIFCITYNHENFIRDAIEGFLMQETTSPVEIFIHDDASTDGTAEIVRAYADKYPHLFWTVLQNENQWSRFSSRRVSFTKTTLAPMTFLPQQRGEFIAMCEGDDYWTDPLKLEKQIDFLRQTPSASGVFHRCRIVDAAKQQVSHPWDQINYQTPYTQKECLFALRSAYATAALIFRKSAVSDMERHGYYLKVPCDHTLDVVISSSGDLAFMNFEGSAYREHAGGVWSSASPLRHHKALTRRFLAFLQDRELRRLYQRELREALFESYGFVWWGLYKGGIASWLRSYFKLLFMFPSATHYFLFLEYGIREGSAVRYTLLDAIKNGTQRLLKGEYCLWDRR